MPIYSEAMGREIYSPDELNDFSPGFSAWLRKNRDIYKRFVSMAKQAQNSRHFKHYSAVTIVEAMRWHTNIHDNDPDFKINNNWRADLARKAMLEYPELNGLFEIRERASRVPPF